jgi:predicted nucleotidyltransferase
MEMRTQYGDLDPEIRRFVSECLDRIRARFHPEALVLFGSRIAGQPHEWSDIDLVLVSRRFEGQHVLDRVRAFDEEIHPHRQVDAFCLTPTEFAARLGGPSVVAEAARSGLRLL